MKILVINCGSSSIKAELYDTTTKEDLFHHTLEEVIDHNIALDSMIEKLLDSKIIDSLDKIDAFAHRVVHGGDIFHDSIIITENKLIQLDSIEHLAPLHNPHNTRAIKYFQKKFPQKVQVAVFDTAFHHTLPNAAFMYALPYELYEVHHIRKYGFHGSSHAFISKKASQLLNIEYEQFNCITLHLGNGASMCAIQNGQSIDTSMGFTPMQGLVMGTRCGDIDPAIVLYLQSHLQMDAKSIERLLNKESGLKGICGKSDMRQIIDDAQNNDKRSQLALDMFVQRIAKYIGAYYITLEGKIDAIIFSGGIGEHSPLIREMVCNKISNALGINIDCTKNEKSEQIISTKKSKITILNIATNEELYIALEAKRLLTKFDL